jgi:hypothetical protein
MESIRPRARATGGSGGRNLSGLGGAGGDAEAIAIGVGTNLDRSTWAEARAIGGRGADGAPSGNATALARATGAITQSMARAERQGAQRAESAEAIANANELDRSIAWTTESRATFAQRSPELASLDGLAAGAVGIVRPLEEDVRERLDAGNFSVRENFDVGGTSDILGLAMLAGKLAGAGRVSSEFGITASTAFELDLSSIAIEQNLLVGVLDPVFDGATQVTSATFEILLEETPVIVSTVTGEPGGEAALDDRTFDLGALSGIDLGDDGLLDVVFRLTVRTVEPNAGFRTDLIFGNSTPGSGEPIPEPASALLTSIGLALLSAHRRRGRSLGRGLSRSRRRANE